MISDIYKFFVENKEMIISLVSLIVAVILGVYTKVSNGLLKKRLKDAKDNGNYIVCPHCKTTVKLKDVIHIYLPDGSIDDDLDGKKDHD